MQARTASAGQVDDEVLELVRGHLDAWLAPGVGLLCEPYDLQVRPGGSLVAVACVTRGHLEQPSTGTIAIVDLDLGTVTPVDDARSAGSPRWAPDGSRLAYVAYEDGGPLLVIRGMTGSVLQPPHTVEIGGIPESFAWAPDGSALLLLVRDHAPARAVGDPDVRIPARIVPRRLLLHRLDRDAVEAVETGGLTVWEMCWAGTTSIVAVASDVNEEDAWYGARVYELTLHGRRSTLLEPRDQVARPVASASGNLIAVIEGIGDTRGMVAGSIVVVDRSTGETRAIEIDGVDVDDVHFGADERLHFSGIRRTSTVVGSYDFVAQGSHLILESEGTITGFGTDAAGRLVVLRNSYDDPPRIDLVSDQETRTVVSFANAGDRYARSVSGVSSRVSWRAPDGLEIDGVLCVPERPGPHPLIVNVHGGPVLAYTDSWQMPYGIFGVTGLLVAHGFAVLHPNPRGSLGRGRDFVHLVREDMGGDDFRDIMSGIDALVDRGIADPERLGILGISYGGFMASWAVTQTDRFAAAVAHAPVTDWRGFRLTTGYPIFTDLFLDGDPHDYSGQFVTRSPLTFVSQVTTPTLLTAATEDDWVHPSQALSFGQALRLRRIPTEVAVYPGEGHILAGLPAITDMLARTLGWFLAHLGNSRNH
jgi:dipeptidyl aminopeptidase/acylaminoacyl peptidase